MNERQKTLLAIVRDYHDNGNATAVGRRFGVGGAWVGQILYKFIRMNNVRIDGKLVSPRQFREMTINWSNVKLWSER